jgi:hypothetical protein
LHGFVVLIRNSHNLIYLANASRSFLGNLILIHATKNLKKGDEITLAYIAPQKLLTERVEFLKRWNFTCQCQLCQLDANDGTYTDRLQLVAKFEAMANLGMLNPRAAIVQQKPMLDQVS